MQLQNYWFIRLIGFERISVMTIVEQYNLTLQIEVVKEQGAETLARLCKYVGNTYFSKCTDLLLSFSDIVNTELYMVKSIEELKSLQQRMGTLEKEINMLFASASRETDRNMNEEAESGNMESYSIEDFDKSLQRNIELLTFNKTQSDIPHVVILGGQSGAGKTTIHRVKMMESEGNYIVIDGDTYRAQHPHFRALQERYGVDSVEYTKAFAGKMVEALIDKLSFLDYNIIIEGTLRSSSVPIQTARLLKDKGYSVDFCLIATKPELSYLTTQLRYLEMLVVDPLQARATPKEHHDGIVKVLVSNINELEQSRLFESIQVYKRDLVQVYDSIQSTESVGTIVEQVLFGPWTKDESDLLAIGRTQEKALRKQLNYGV